MAFGSFPARVSLFYAALFLGIGIQVPFFPVWLAAKGLSASEISIVLAALIASRVLSSPGLAFLADRTGRRRAILVILAALTLAGALALAAVEGFWALLAAGILMSACWSPIIPLLEALAISGAEQHGADYGRIRLWGSIAFIAGSLGAGAALDRIEPRAIILLIAAALALLFAASWLLPADRAADLRRQHPLAPGEAARLLAAPLFLLFLAAASLAQASHAVYYGFGALHWQQQRLSGGTIGALWSAGIAAEVVLFTLSRSVVRGVGPAQLVMVGAGAAALRWGAMACDPGPWALGPLQLLHALSFGATHLGTMHVLLRALPPGLHNTAQAVTAVAMGTVMGLTTLAAGPLYRALGGEAYAAMALMAVLALGLAWRFRSRWSGGLPIAESGSRLPP